MANYIKCCNGNGDQQGGNNWSQKIVDSLNN